MDISKIINFKHCALTYFCARLQLHSFTRDAHIPMKCVLHNLIILLSLFATKIELIHESMKKNRLTKTIANILIYSNINSCKKGENLTE